MFNNLVESNKHTEDFKRKGSFFLATIIAYSLFLVSAGVTSVLAYDTHLENQSLELVSLLTPVPVEQQVQKQQEPKPAKSSEQKIATRTAYVAPVNDSFKQPDKVSSTASPVKEMPKGPVEIGTTDYDPPTGILVSPSGNNSGDNSTTTSSNKPLVIETDPPPVVKKPEEKKVTTISKGVINGQARHLQKPVYPVIARTARVSGEVRVQVLIDESGRVVSANVISGHPLLKAAASQAALQSSFTPTKLSEIPVKVSGIIVYNFIN